MRFLWFIQLISSNDNLFFIISVLFVFTKRQVIENVIPHLYKKDLVFSTTGMFQDTKIKSLKKQKKNSKNFSLILDQVHIHDL